MSESSAIPNHVAIIMDGNGRWATARGLNRNEGHKAGLEALRTTVEAAANLGIKHLTLFGFSSENWNRPEKEVTGIMNLIRIYIKRELDELNKNGVCVKVIGDISKFDNDIIEAIKKCEEETKNNKKITVTIALSYGGRQDIVFAAQKLAQDVKDGKLEINEIDLGRFADGLSTKGLPEPDLLIRTSGEQRLSNFLMWQLAYTELYFTNTFWPDFNENDLKEAINTYQNRDRRFGKVSERVKAYNGK